MSSPGPPHTADPQANLLYFFLSYARLGPLPDDSHCRVSDGRRGRSPDRATEHDPGSETDPEVQKLFEELDAEIVGRTRGRTPAGFYDRHIPFDADPRKALSDALSRTQVFVPLYSPSYLKTSWTRREQSAFHIRMTREHQDPDTRTLPVLWTPVPLWTVDTEDRQPLERARNLVPDVPEYSENGLRALCILPTYCRAYHRMLDHIAAQIILLAETASVRPGAALDLNQVPQAPTDDPSFIITVLKAGSEPEMESLWHPYSGRQELPVTEYAVRTAERLGLAPLVVEFEHLPEYSENNPALAVIDPRILQQPGGEDYLCQAFRDLPIWVRPLMVGDDQNPSIDVLARRAQQLLAASAPASSGLQVQVVERIKGPQDLEVRLPLALAKARQAYLSCGKYHLPSSSAPRPRLTGGGASLNGREPDAKH